MVEISDEICCVFHATVEERDGSYVIEVPARDVSTGAVRAGGGHRVAFFPPVRSGSEGESEQPDDHGQEPADDRGRAGMEPPVSDGDRYTVDIDSLGEQGDGIARVERGYVIIVPDTEPGERVTIEITDVTETVGFGDVVRREAYYE